MNFILGHDNIPSELIDKYTGGCEEQRSMTRREYGSTLRLVELVEALAIVFEKNELYGQNHCPATGRCYSRSLCFVLFKWK